jgi:Fic family protein
MLSDPTDSCWWGNGREYLRQVDLNIKQTEAVTDPDRKHYYLARSLVEEASTSSQLEGASTTREAAKRMLLESRAPRDRSERMIKNNYQTMQRISEIKETEMTKDLLGEIQGVVTEGMGIGLLSM